MLALGISVAAAIAAALVAGFCSSLGRHSLPRARLGRDSARLWPVVCKDHACNIRDPDLPRPIPPPLPGRAVEAAIVPLRERSASSARRA